MLELPSNQVPARKSESKPAPRRKAKAVREGTAERAFDPKRLKEEIERLRVPQGPLLGENIKVLPWQFELLEAVAIHKETALTVARGNGKALALWTPIRTSIGWKTMATVEVGDRVFAPDGTQTRITKVHDIETGRPCYRLDFDSNESLVADADHQWDTIARYERPDGGHNNSPRKRPLRSLRTTEEVFASVHVTQHGKPSANHRIPIAKALRSSGVDLIVGPYTLGVWLGDGTSANGNVTKADADVEVMDRVRSEGYRLTRHVYSGRAVWRVHGLVTRLREIGVLGNKHIPAEYFRASVSERMELLRGIVDTDGYVMKQGSIEITTVRRRLAEDYVELIRGLGFKCRMPNALDAKLNGRVVGEKFRVQFHPGEKIVAALRRKVDALPKRPSRGTSMSFYIRDAEPVPSEPVRCITVEREDGMYLAGKTLIPTHNSTICAAMASVAMMPGSSLFVPRGQVVLTATSMGQARKTLFEHILMFMQPVMYDVTMGGLKLDRSTWRVMDNSHHMEIIHLSTGTSLKVVGSDPKRAMGLAPSLVVADEPSFWEAGGDYHYQALRTSLMKQPGARMLLIGTRPRNPLHFFSRLLFNPPKDTKALVHAAVPEDLKDGGAYRIATVKKANPSYKHMELLRADLHSVRDEARKLGGMRRAGYLAFHLNAGTSESDVTEDVIAADAWDAVTEAEQPDRKGPVSIGVDLGGGNSLSAVAFYWHETGRLECRGALPAYPSLEERGQADGIGMAYEEMREQGVLHIHGQKETKNAEFLGEHFATISGYEWLGVACDRYKITAVKQALVDCNEDESLIVDRAVGRGADGWGDLEAFRGAVLEEHLKPGMNLALEHAIMSAVVKRDSNGNASMDKSGNRGRIDVLQAVIHAVGLGERHRYPPEKPKEYDLSLFVSIGKH